MTLSDTEQRFILHWGEMGTRWGINRTVAQIHALLYLSEKPLNAEEICDLLSVARSNASNSLRELQGWGIIHVTHVLGDRRDHYESIKDVWEMFETILDERKKREIDPTLKVLRDLADAKAGPGSQGKHTKERITEILAFVESMSTWYSQMRTLPRTIVQKLIGAGARISKFFDR